MPDGFLDRKQQTRVDTVGAERIRQEVEVKDEALRIIDQIGDENAAELWNVIKKNWIKLTTIPAIAAILVYDKYDTYTNMFGEEVPNIQQAIIGSTLAGLAVASIVLLFSLMGKLPKTKQD